ncbi:MAG: DMT family transporter [Proteobacteria bacterium]|nr:DMT family transporter [Pseudomonadota bacterium]
MFSATRAVALIYQQPSLKHFLLLLALGAMWASSFTFVKVTIETIPPMSAVAGRVVIALIVFLAIAWAKGYRLRMLSLRDWGFCAIVGVSGTSAPFFLINWGEIYVDSGLAAILMSMVPLFTIVLAHITSTNEKLTPLKVGGVFVGLAGIVILMGGDTLAGLGDRLWAQLAITGAALLYALGNASVRFIGHLPMSLLAAAVMLCATVFAVVFAVVEAPWTIEPSVASMVSMVLSSLIGTTAGYYVFFYLILATGPTFVALNNYLIPILGVIWGVLFLAEEPASMALVALGLVLAGITITNSGIRRERRLNALPAPRQ